MSLAAFAAELDPRRLPADVVARAKLCVLDLVSASLTIGATDGSAAALALADTGGPSRVIGRRERTSPEGAAFVNASAAAATIRTDTHPASASHPGMVVIPAVLAAAEAQSIGGAAVLAGVVAGYEFMLRLGLAVITPPLASIFRPTGLLGPGAAALSVAKATGLGRAETVSALAIACHGAAGFNEWVHDGTNEHIYHGGFAARHGISAVALARAGAEGAPRLLEGRSGLLAAFGAGERAATVIEGLGRDFLLLDVVFKPAPACIFAQSPVQAAAALVAQHKLDPAEIDCVDIETSARAVDFPGCNNPGPFADPPSAQQSIPFGVAAVLAAGAVCEQAWAHPDDPAVNALAARCRVHPIAEPVGDRQPARLRVQLRDGRTLLRADVPDFRSMSQDEVIGRFLGVAAPLLSDARASQALDAIMRLDEAADVNDVTALVVPH